jgi:hypothetical protein
MADKELLGADVFEFPGIITPGEEVDEGDETDRQALVTRLMEEAVGFYEENLEPDQVKATEYYMGRPYGNEVKGRSKVVTTEVRDVTLRQLPSLMRIFFSPERVVEFRGHGPEDAPVAAQQTDWVNWVVTKQNDSYRTLYEVFEDALVRRLGVAKWWWEKRVRTTGINYSGLTEEEVVILAGEEGIEFEIISTTPAGGDGSPATYEVRVERSVDEGRERYAAVPPEEFFFTPNARDLDTSALVAHARDVPISDVVAMGYDDEDVRKHAGRRRATDSDTLREARQFHGGDGSNVHDSAEEGDPSQRVVYFTEAYILMDDDGDGISEIVKFDCVGPTYEILNGEGEVVDECPFAVFGAHIEAHTMVGLSNYDLAGDLQLIGSQVMRSTLDSLAVSVNPITEIVNGEVNMQDAMNTDVLKFVRVRRPGMIREVKHQFVGPDTLPVMQYLKEIEEERTGTTRASAGLDADVLQSTTKAAVTGTFSAAQQRLELIARNLAETGMRRLFKGILGLSVKHQQPGRMMRLRGKYVPIDPRAWDTSLDVEVNIGLGQGTPEDRIAALNVQLQTQMALLAQGSPLVSNVEVRATLARLAELSGWRNAEDFYKPWGPEEQAQAEQAASQQTPPPDANMALIQIEQVKAQNQMQLEQAKLQLETWKATMEDDRERDKLARDAALREKELELKYAVDIQDSVMKAAVAADRAEMDADVRAQQLAQAPATAGGEA